MRLPAPAHVLVYGAEPSSSVVQALRQSTGLPVRYIDKRAVCEGTSATAPFGCILKATSLSQFHNMLWDARMIVAVQNTRYDVPTLLEAAACGTPVLVFHGRHRMLERFADGTHAIVWENVDDLSAAAKRSLNSTSRGNHKFEEWQPPPLSSRDMRKRLAQLIEAHQAVL